MDEARRSHAGCLPIPNSFRNEDFGAIISSIEGQLNGVSQEEWMDRVAWRDVRLLPVAFQPREGRVLETHACSPILSPRIAKRGR